MGAEPLADNQLPLEYLAFVQICHRNGVRDARVVATTWQEAAYLLDPAEYEAVALDLAEMLRQADDYHAMLQAMSRSMSMMN